MANIEPAFSRGSTVCSKVRLPVALSTRLIRACRGVDEYTRRAFPSSVHFANTSWGSTPLEDLHPLRLLIEHHGLRRGIPPSDALSIPGDGEPGKIGGA
jgi:hypothetical protein